jgi:hypothetical protein
MSSAALSSQQLRTIVEERWQRDPDALVVGLHVVNGLEFPSEVESGSGKAQVVRADTVFQVREAMVDAERNRKRIVLLTKLHEPELGLDVVGRLARGKLFPINNWASLCSLFKAKELDRSVSNSELVNALLDSAPPDGYPPVSAGILDAGTVWRAVCRHVFDMGEREPDLVALLLWATDRIKSGRYLAASDGLREALLRRLDTNLGEGAVSIFRMVDSEAGPDALALAVVCQVVFDGEAASVLEAAAARMEQYHGNTPIPRHVGRILGRTASEAITDLDRNDDPKFAQQHLQRADEFLRQFLCDDHAYRSPLTLLSYEQRLARFGQQIIDSLASGKDISECEKRQGEVAEHRRAKLGQRAAQVARTEMALRLLRWLSSAEPMPTSFSELADEYRRELAFVDWARESICRGEDVPLLTQAYQQLDKAVTERREKFNRRFAQELANWTSTGSTSGGLLGVEHVLENVVAKICEASNSVLLIVLDGMSWAVCQELLEDVRAEHWFEATLDEASIPPNPVIATLPSVTEYSRASLLSGSLVRGDCTLEQKNFEASTVLRQVCDKKYPPQLFHKKEATEGARGVVGDDLSRAIIEPKCRIVGVVLNAIDDRLNNAQQVRDDWTINRISVLAPILKLARDSGRVVILASDHGHVWHRPDTQLAAGDGGNRWRSQDGRIEDGEIAATGQRVRGDADQNAVIVPWSESLHYGKQQNGYHGGATPQEMICPLVVLMDKASTYSGLYSCEYPKPDWWVAKPAPTSHHEEAAPSAPVLGPRRPLTLFDSLSDEKPQPKVDKKATPERPKAATGWIEQFLASQAYKEQRKFVKRHAPDDETIRRSLVALDSNGGILTPAAFCKTTDLPAGRLDGLMARIQRVLNVDGYEVLIFSRAENRIELNMVKLKRQFDLE